ncbi:MAG: GNAT family N-acetyltransferase [Oscillospiraceae bacterium]|jgi:GNAT superfamily N-acetyltransferase|nr:GNAT family N-acetyltransferase [Oscillospiraceae bacterium]
MSEIFTRKPYISETNVLRNIWKNVFGNIGEESFFNHYYNPELCVIADTTPINTSPKNAPVAAGYLVPFGEIICGSISVPCAMLFSIATLPMYRGMGFGTVIVHRLIELAREQGYPAVVLCPAEDELFDYYDKRTEFCEWFYVYEQKIEAPIVKSNVEITEISPNEYKIIRDELLKKVIYIKHDLPALEYQALLCKEMGGGLFKIGNSCAIVECQPDGAVWIKELLTPGSNYKTPSSINNIKNQIPITEVISSIARKFPASEYTVRTPSRIDMGIDNQQAIQRRFGMLALSENIKATLSNKKYAPWYGMAFD